MIDNHTVDEKNNLLNTFGALPPIQTGDDVDSDAGGNRRMGEYHMDEGNVVDKIDTKVNIEDEGKEDEGKDDEDEGVIETEKNDMNKNIIDKEAIQNEGFIEEDGLERLRRVQQRMKLRSQNPQSTKKDPENDPSLKTEDTFFKDHPLPLPPAQKNRSSRSKQHLSREKRSTLQTIIEKHAPIDMVGIHQHEIQYLNNKNMKNYERDLLKQKPQHLGDLPYQSKMYMNAKEEYANNMSKDPKEKNLLNAYNSKERIKQYYNHIKHININHNKLIEASNPVHVYGRFGDEWNRQLNRHETDTEYNQNVRQVGNTYLAHAKNMVKRDRLDRMEGGVERPPLEKLDYHQRSDIAAERQVSENRKRREKGMEYLKYSKSKINRHVPSSEMDSKTGVMQSSEDNKYMRSVIDKMDSDVNMIEGKMKHNKVDCNIDELYLENIRKKLSILGNNI